MKPKKTTKQKVTPPVKRNHQPASPTARPHKARTTKEPTPVPEETVAVAVPSPRSSKKDLVIALLSRENGATIAEMMNATGWQAHSVRGFMSGTLKKKLGLTVRRKQHPAAADTYTIER